jgi:alpha-mannosidase
LPTLQPEEGRIVVRSDRMVAAVNCATGLLDQYTVDGVDCLAPGAFLPRVINDNEDPWGMTVNHFRDEAGAFSLMSPEAGTKFSGLRLEQPIPSVRVVEEGPVRVVVESLLAWGDSFVVLTYKLPREGAEIEAHVRVHWNEKDKALKLAMPVPFANFEYRGQVAYGADTLPARKQEVVAQKWTAAVSADGAQALTVINDGIYGSDVVNDEIRMTLLRSAAYCGHPIGERPVVPQNRYTPRIDQGERQFTFWIQGGPATERLGAVDREALAHNEKPFLVSFCPSGQGEAPAPGIVIDNPHVLVTAFKKAENGDRYVVRLFEPTGMPRTAILKIPVLGIEREVRLGAFEIQTWLVDPAAKSMVPADLIERPLGG